MATTGTSLRQARKGNRFERITNRLWYRVVASGLVPRRWPGSPRIGSTTLEVRGRKSGAIRRIPVTWVEFEGNRYLVAMLGEESDWVHNARASGGDVWFKRGRRRKAHLEELPMAERAPVLAEWYKRVGNSTPKHYIGLPANAPLSDFERIAPRWPVWRVTDVAKMP
jgi:deazaflavin-dependent oxidoreductase (nitroreductase family)